MIFLFYGPDLVASREALLKLRDNYLPGETISLSEDLPLGELQNSLVVTPFFSREKLVLVETASEKSPLLKNDGFFTLLGSKPGSTHVAVWVGGNLNSKGTVLKNFQALRSETQFFSAGPARNVFPFLTALIRKQRSRSLGELRALRCEGNNDFYLLTMIVWQLRALIRYASGDLKPSAFQRPALEAAKGLFSSADLTQIYRDIYRADLGSKTGQKDLSLELFWLVERITA